jgi:hypothetical protein
VLPINGPNSLWPTLSVPDSLALTSGALLGTTVGAGAEVAPVDGTAVGVAGDPGSLVDGTGVAVAEDPHANMATSKRTKGARIISLGFFNQ